MKSILIITSILFAQISFAAPTATTPNPASIQKKYDLKIDYSVDGKHIDSPTVILSEGDPTTVTKETADGKFFLTIATVAHKAEPNKKVIALEMIIGKFEKDGKETILSKPKIIANEGETATISIGDAKTKKERISLTIVGKSL